MAVVAGCADGFGTRGYLRTGLALGSCRVVPDGGAGGEAGTAQRYHDHRVIAGTVRADHRARGATDQRYSCRDLSDAGQYRRRVVASRAEHHQQSYLRTRYGL